MQNLVPSGCQRRSAGSGMGEPSGAAVRAAGVPLGKSPGTCL